jgi:hypothetical protein
VTGCCEHGNEPHGSIKDGNCIGSVSDYQHYRIYIYVCMYLYYGNVLPNYDLLKYGTDRFKIDILESLLFGIDGNLICFY